MDSMKYKAKLEYMPGPMPYVENQETDAQFLQSSAPYMPLYDHELGLGIKDNLSYPVLEPPRIVDKAQSQIAQEASPPRVAEIAQRTPSPTDDNNEVNLKELVKTGKRKIMKTLKVLRLMFILKLIGVIIAGFALLGEDPIAPGSIPCMLLLTFATIAYGKTICIGKRSAKKMKLNFMKKGLKKVICHYCCYFIALFLACMIMLDIIHFNAHMPTLNQEINPLHREVLIESAPSRGNAQGGPPPRGMPHGDPPSRGMNHGGPPPRRMPHGGPPPRGPPARSETKVITFNGQNSFPQFSPNNIFGESIIFTITEQGIVQNSTTNTLPSSSKDFTIAQAFGGLPEIDQELADIIKLFELQLKDSQESPPNGLRNLRQKDHGRKNKHHNKDRKHKKKHEEVPEPAINPAVTDFYIGEPVPVKQRTLQLLTILI
jgi:cell division protein FtsL